VGFCQAKRRFDSRQGGGILSGLSRVQLADLIVIDTERDAAAAGSSKCLIHGRHLSPKNGAT
jgi:hypothetical protein